MNQHIAECINRLGAFCGIRDVPCLTAEALNRRYGIRQADVMVLFGGSILIGGDVLAEAMRNHVAKQYIIVGGEGHTTETLRVKMHREFPEIQTAGLPEAQVFEAYLEYRYGLHADYLECNSTNCGNNITYLLDLMEVHCIPHASIILSQDAAMQHRMAAGMRKYARNIQIINYAVYQARVRAQNSTLVFEDEIWGMWDMEHYITLLMGEIPRLSDTAGGYGPKGKNYIAHVDIPMEVETAFMELRKEYPEMVREANPLYAG